jgi:hypothetical protein
MTSKIGAEMKSTSSIFLPLSRSNAFYCDEDGCNQQKQDTYRNSDGRNLVDASRNDTKTFLAT